MYSFKEKKQQENVSTENGKLKNKGALPGLSQFLATESHLRIIKNAFMSP